MLARVRDAHYLGRSDLHHSTTPPGARSGHVHVRRGTALPRGAHPRRHLRDRTRTRSWRHGDRVPRARQAPQARGGDQAAAARARLPLRDPLALPPRGGDVGAAVAPEHCPDLLGRRKGRAGLLRHAVRRGGQPRQADPGHRPDGGGRRSPRAQGSRRGAQPRPFALGGAPRHQARQHPPQQGRWAGHGHRLRHRPRHLRRGRLAADGHRRRHRHAALHVP